MGTILFYVMRISSVLLIVASILIMASGLSTSFALMYGLFCLGAGVACWYLAVDAKKL